MKLTLEDLTPLRRFIVETGNGDITVEGHHAQVKPEGTLEIFHTVRNMTSIVQMFAEGRWSRVHAQPLTRSEVEAVEALTAKAREEATASQDDLVKRAIALSAEEAFPQLKH